MIKLYLLTVTIFITLLTITVGVLKPEINKPVRFAADDFQISNTELAAEPTAAHKISEQVNTIVNSEQVQTTTIEKTIETSAPATQTTTRIFENKNNQISKNINLQKQTDSMKNSTKTITAPQARQQSKTIATQNTQSGKQKTVTTQTAQIPQSVKDILNNAQKTQTTTETQNPKESEKVKLPQIDPTPKPIQKTVETVPANERPLTEQEEIIVWNTWRSNLQNKIMRDTEISAPIGTAFKFSFTVDKKGRISNLRTWAVPSTYNTVAINYLKPLILRYMNTNDPILNFPSRTKRVITNVTGGFVISTQDRFSTPNDFSDIEKVKTLR